MDPIDYDPMRSALYTPERRDTIFAAGRTYTPLQLAIEAARLAYVRAETSAAEQARLTAALARVGFGPPSLFGDAETHSQGFGSIRSSDGAAIVAFRGTQADELADLATDLEATQVAWTESAGHVHEGFAEAARALLPPISDWLRQHRVPATALTVTGHSLGAAIATLAATVWRPARLVTLGSPRVGTADFVASLRNIECVRLVDCCDAITELPPPLFGYTHSGPPTYIDEGGKVTHDPAADQIAHDRAQARANYVLRQSWRRGSVLLRDLADHAPINYARAFFP